ncbi:MAG: hypothetical protein AB7R55_18010 [Gemmatimonadales bacterium]
MAGEPVPVAPAVKVVNSSGAPVVGVSVAFAIGQGGGSVTGASAATGSDGVATVGAWTLGSAGPNTLTATVTGATSGSPVTFTATAREILIQPSQDTTMSGVVRVTRFVVPQGVTVTVTDSLVIRADSTMQIDGAIVGDCTPVTLDGQLDVIVNGTLDNACADLTADGAPMRLVALGGYELNPAATVETTGDVEITNDPTLTDADVQPGASPVASSSAAATGTAANNRCYLRARYVPRPAKRPTPPTGVHGANGKRGADMQVNCRGNLLADGGFVFRAMDGGDGARGVHQPASGPADASGGNGGDGGKLIFRATGNIGFAGSNVIESGDGGHGGSATALAGASPTGAVAPAAVANGGNGGLPGLVSFRFLISINYIDLTEVTIGAAGNGGDATAVGARGADATGQKAAQAGGPADALAGDAGSTPAIQIHTTGAVTVVNPTNLDLDGGDGGVGGEATGEGGQGGAGDVDNPDGAAGGDITAAGGGGGDARLLDLTAQPFGRGGDGGRAVFRNAGGGRGYSNCALSGFGPGGKGGAGGDVSGVEGTGGSGASAGSHGGVFVDFAGNGGHAGNGWPAAGARGKAGRDLVLGTPTGVGGPSFLDGNAGFACVFADLQSVRITIDRSGPPNQPSCEGSNGTFRLRSVANGALSFTATTTDGSLRLTPVVGAVPQPPPSTSGQAFGDVVIQDFIDPCKVGTAFTGEYTFRAADGLNWVIRIPVTVILNQT